MTRTHRFLSGFVTGYAHLILATIAGLWLTPFFLRHLGQSTFGLWLCCAGNILSTAGCNWKAGP